MLTKDQAAQVLASNSTLPRSAAMLAMLVVAVDSWGRDLTDAAYGAQVTSTAISLMKTQTAAVTAIDAVNLYGSSLALYNGGWPMGNDTRLRAIAHYAVGMQKVARAYGWYDLADSGCPPPGIPGGDTRVRP